MSKKRHSKWKIYYKEYDDYEEKFIFKSKSISRLRQSILSNKLSEIGKITVKTREVNLNADKKRLWLESLTGINHKMNRSMPLSLNYFTKEQI